MKYRRHRGGLRESLETTVEINNLNELINHIESNYHIKVKDINFDYVGYDERTRWETYNVSIKTEHEKSFHIIGMSNSIF